MVSQLSLNLLSEYSSSEGSRKSAGVVGSGCVGSGNGGGNTNNSIGKGGAPSSSAGSASKFDATVGDSGYSADREQPSDSLPDCINFPSSSTSSTRARKGRYSADEGDDDVLPVRVSKRLKMAERTFLAAMAKNDIESGGFTLPPLRTDAPRAWPTQMGVDMSSVEHQYSNNQRKFDDKTQMKGTQPLYPPTHVKKSIYDNAAAILDLFQVCEPYYKLPLEPETNATGGASGVDKNSATSSVTDTESGGQNSSGEDENEEFTEDIKQSLVTMGEALSLSSQARVITLGVHPFMVVHVNAAFTKMTGMSSVRVLGKSFGELLEDRKLVSILESARDEYANSLNMNSVMIVQEQAILKVKSTTKRTHLSCGVSVSPVGSWGEVTHLALELRPSGVVVGGANNGAVSGSTTTAQHESGSGAIPTPTTSSIRENSPILSTPIDGSVGISAVPKITAG